MKLFTKFLTLALMLALVPAIAFAGFNDHKYYFSVVDQRAIGGNESEGKLTTGVLTFVYTAGTKTLATLYSDEKRTSLTNPISRSQFATDDAVKFYAEASTVDLVLAHSDGSIAKYSSVSYDDHLLKLDRSGVEKCVIVPFSPSDNTETDTTIDLPYGAWVKDAMVEVVTADSSETLDVGLLSTETSGDANGFLASVSVSTTGFKRPIEATVGSSETYISTAYYGALLGPVAVGTDANTDTGQASLPGHVVTGSNAVSITYTGSAGSDTAAGYIYVFYQHLR